MGSSNEFLELFDDEMPTYGRRLGEARAAPDAALNLFGEGAGRRLYGSTDQPTSSWTGPLPFDKLYGDNSRTQFWNYPGSFTTPPCTEAVDFYILMTPAQMTSTQLDKFK